MRDQSSLIKKVLVNCRCEYKAQATLSSPEHALSFHEGPKSMSMRGTLLLHRRFLKLLLYRKDLGGIEENKRYFGPISKIMLRCIYGCQKWIPDKILHRYYDSIFFSTHFFFDKKKHFENAENPLGKNMFPL